MNPDMAFEPTALTVPLEQFIKLEEPSPHHRIEPIDPGLLNPNQ
jgi:hypothetical protein